MKGLGIVQMNFFEVQPAFCRAPLPQKDIQWKSKFKAVCFYNPADLYERIHDYIDPFKRTQSVGFSKMFPNSPGVCGCGCGQQLTGRRTRWASEDCAQIAEQIYRIIYGDLRAIQFYLWHYHGYKCVRCGIEKYLEVDHIFPVKFGGGGGWLSNYQLLCKKCHRDKTNEDFGWKLNNRTQTKIFQ